METIGEKIKRIRKSKGISQNTVSKFCGITQPSYANIESGKTQNITIEIGRGIADALLLPFNELFEIGVPFDYASEELKRDYEKLLEILNNAGERILELEKRIEEQDLFIEIIKKKDRLAKRNESIVVIEVWFENFIADEVKERKAKTEGEKNRSNKYHEAAINQLKFTIENSLKEGLLTIEEIIRIFFINDDFGDLIESESNSKDMFIDKCTVLINKFCNVNNDQVQNVIEGYVITKWDTEKVKNRRIQSE